ncbi:MAG: membrane protein insertion efficiency factor YidD [Planctomycetota bacterium]
MRNALELLRRVLAAPLLLLLWIYRRFVSRWTPATCRFSPTCSAYAEEALRTLPLPRALALIVWRLVRCQPFCRGGYDPVPTRPCCGADSEQESGPESGHDGGPPARPRR